ncbi:MAG: hypothetical protein ACREO1_11870 [Arenimonas sp.]
MDRNINPEKDSYGRTKREVIRMVVLEIIAFIGIIVALVLSFKNW